MNHLYYLLDFENKKSSSVDTGPSHPCIESLIAQSVCPLHWDKQHAT